MYSIGKLIKSTIQNKGIKKVDVVKGLILNFGERKVEVKRKIKDLQ